MDIHARVILTSIYTCRKLTSALDEWLGWPHAQRN